MQEDGREPDETEVRWFGFRAELAVGLRDRVDIEELGRIVDPSSAESTVHWGRNYLYAADLQTTEGPVRVVVKQFKNQGWRRVIERRLRGSKAERSWRGAAAITAAGIPTPEPLVLVESEAPDGPSFFVTRLVEPAHEVRHFFRRLQGDPSAGAFPVVEPVEFFTELGRFVRRLHDAGIWHRDLSMGNVLAGSDDPGDLDFFLLDCNRARWGRRMGVVRRCRDSCRFPIVEPLHQDAFLAGYWGEKPSRIAFRRWFWAASVRGYLLKHAIKNRLKVLRPGRRHAHGGSHHPHLPQIETDASARDKSVWDRLSDQPHQHAGRWEKRWIRLADAPDHLRDLGVVAATAPAAFRRYRRLREGLHSNPTPFGGAGVCLRPWPEDPEAHLAAVEELGIRRVLLRLHPWDGNHDAEENLAGELHARGYEISFALPQNRELVRDRERWRAAVEELAQRFTPFGCHFQVGQAPNRSKWGVWTRGEFMDLYVDAARILRRYDGVEVMGPAVIDFEFQVTLALANRRCPGLVFDPLSSLLYVDRRGAPENRQMGLDTVDKVLMLRAIAETGRNCSERLWITEVNWPLWEGPHSPAGKTVSVDEKRQADYLVRYFLLVLGTGLVERVYWWRLVARGYGLIAPDADDRLRRRPSFYSLQTLNQRLDGSVFLGPLPAHDGVHLYVFEREGKQQVVGWAVAAGQTGDLPEVPARAFDRAGHEIEAPSGPRVRLGPSPVYFELGAEGLGARG